MNQPLRLVMYLRKSSEAEDRQQLSIPAQERELRELAARQGLLVVGEPIAEAMSAKRPGRPGFAELMQRITKRQADGILVWALDRLARNPIDGGSLMWALGERQIQTIVAPDRSYTGSGDDKLMMSIMFGMATKYSDDLSKNVKRGNRQALVNGRWPGLLPIGYMRRQPDKAVIPDPDRWAKVRQLWDLRLTGTSVESICKQARTELDLKTPLRGTHGCRFLSMSETYHMFANGFYAGQMRYGGEEYVGAHPPMVTAAEFARVRDMTRGRNCTPPDQCLHFRYGRLLRCGSCGATVTAENTTNRYGKRYVYYHCGRKQRFKVFCPERSVEEANLEQQILAFVSELTLPGDVAALILDELQYQLDCGAAAQARVANLAQLRRRLAKADESLVSLRRIRVEGEISADDFKADQEHYLAERERIADQIRSIGNQGIIEPLRRHVSLLNNAKSRFEAADDAKRRVFLLEVASNFSLMDRKLLILAKEPLEALRALPKIPTGWAVSEIVRTLLSYQIPKDHE